MEDILRLEKNIGLYVLFLSSLDSIILWPLGCHIIDTDKKKIEIIGCLFGIIGLIYCIGKYLGNILILKINSKVSPKILLSILLLASAFSNFFLMMESRIFGFSVNRFISGFCSNSQISVRKLLDNIIEQQKIDREAQLKKNLLAIKFGQIFGVLAILAFSNPNKYLIEKTDEKSFNFRILAVFLVIIQFSGFFLVLSMDISDLVINQTENSIDSKAVKRENLSIANDLNRNIEFFVSPGEKLEERSVVVNIKPISFSINFSTPEKIIPESACIAPVKEFGKKLKKFRSYGEIDDNEERKKLEDFDELSMRMSIIMKDNDDQDMDNEDDRKNFETLEETMPQREEDTVFIVNYGLNLSEACLYRAFLTFVSGMFVESIPILLYFNSENMDTTNLYSFLIVFFSIFFIPVLAGLLKKISYQFIGKLVIAYFVLANCYFAVFGHMLNFNVVVGIISFSFMLNEIVQPLGCILISDSVSVLDRRTQLEKNDKVCILTKGVASLLGPALVAITIRNYVFIGFLVFALEYAMLLFFSLKIFRKFYYLNEVPYKI